MRQLYESLLSRLPESVRDAVADAILDGTWIKVRRALSAFDHCPVGLQGPEVRIQILSSFEVKSIEPALLLGLRCIPSRPKLWIAPFNTIEEELMTPDSPVYKERGLATVVMWRADELLPDLCYPASSATARSAPQWLSALKERITKMVEAYRKSCSAPLFLATMPLPAALGGALLGSRLPPGASKMIAEFNVAIFECSMLDSQIHVLDFNWWSAQQGSSHYDLKMDFLAKQPLTVHAAISLGFFLGRNLRPLIIPRRKVLVVDLDNTLWGGILGEDGLSKIKLGHDFPGNVHLRIQREIRELKRQGVLLVLASKNDEPSARQALASLPDMLLRWEDFVSHKVNFNHKYLTIRESATELGLGLDSFVLLDDSDYEREQMKAFNPEVLVLNDQSHPLHMLTSLLQTDVFDVHQVTEEDLQRHHEYELRSARSTSGEGNIEEFLSSLELRAELQPVQNANIDRVVQMLGKTNQFNVTTRRHRLEDIQLMISRPGAVNLCLRLADKFGDQGIVGVLLAEPRDAGNCLIVDSFLVSCRALGRGVERVLWAELLNRATAAGVRRIHAHYLPTPKNALVANLFDQFGMKKLDESNVDTHYVLEPVEPVDFPAWITVSRNAL
jgi:FkbH-like protein